MRSLMLAFAAAACVTCIPAAAFCVHNDLKDRDVSVNQEEHPDWRRNDSRFQKSLKPGTKACCEAKSLDCNPNGRMNSLVGLEVLVHAGEPPLKCGPAAEPRKARLVKVMGAGTLRVVPNPRHDPKAATGHSPYIVRIWSHDNQDITGPAGLPCRPN